MGYLKNKLAVTLAVDISPAAVSATEYHACTAREFKAVGTLYQTDGVIIIAVGTETDHVVVCQGWHATVDCCSNTHF